MANWDRRLKYPRKTLWGEHLKVSHQSSSTLLAIGRYSSLVVFLMIRCGMQGVSPPVYRSEKDFDPGAKLEVDVNWPLIKFVKCASTYALNYSVSPKNESSQIRLANRFYVFLDILINPAKL